jgi:hypothetical protein
VIHNLAVAAKPPCLNSLGSTVLLLLLATAAAIEGMPLSMSWRVVQVSTAKLHLPSTEAASN